VNAAEVTTLISSAPSVLESESAQVKAKAVVTMKFLREIVFKGFLPARFRRS
jgi:hypothetical protein